jgi:RNA polymerase sigma factor (sigma-70 family)
MIKNLTEFELVEQCKANNRSAQEKVYAMLAPKMTGICERYVGNREEARDIVQDVFFKVFTEISAFKYESAFSTWVIRILINTSINHVKERNRKFNHLDIEDNKSLFNVSESEDEAEALQELDTTELVALIRELPDNYRLVLNLYAIEGFTHKEISKKLGITVQASKVLLYRSRSKLLLAVEERLKKKLVKGKWIALNA